MRCSVALNPAGKGKGEEGVGTLRHEGQMLNNKQLPLRMITVAMTANGEVILQIMRRTLQNHETGGRTQLAPH